MKNFTIFAALLALLIIPLQSIHAADKESVYERVMRTGTIRCGYIVWPPIIEKDANGKLSGVFYDYMEALGAASGLDIEWTQELNLESFLEDLNNGRYDVECSGGWPNAKRARRGIYTDPIYYLALQPFVRAEDSRFSAIEDFNSKNVKVAIWDGEYSEILANRYLPEAHRVSIPSTLPASHLMMDVVTGKADVAFVTDIFAAEFLKSNPGTLKPVIIDPPLQLFPQNMTVKTGEQNLRDFLNTATEELMLSGRIEEILKKYEREYGIDFIRVAKPYEALQ